jgi:hypothetical protein
MAVEKFWNAGIFYDGRNYTGQTNKVTLSRKVSMLDTSVFGVATRVNGAGQDETSVSINGWWSVGEGPTDTQSVDPALFNALTATYGAPLLIYPKKEDLGVAFFYPAVEGTFNFFGNFGDIAPFNAELHYSQYGAASARIPDCRGVVGLLPNAITGASGNGSYVQYTSPLGSTDWLCFTVHLISTDATNVTFNLVSDDASGFATPTTRLTSGALTAGGSYIGTLQGPIATDTYYRVAYTRTGGTTFTAVAAFGYTTLP